MRILSLVVSIALLSFSGWWAFNNIPEVHRFIGDIGKSSKLITLEARFSPEQVMENNRKELLGDGTDRTFGQPELRFYPYLLLDVKYVNKDRSTGEGQVLWGLGDGEMVLDTQSWETTHGFQDCINADATAADFRVVHAIARSGGTVDRDTLIGRLQVESDTLDRWIDSVHAKHLVVLRGGEYRLHFAQPKLDVVPRTMIKQGLVTKEYAHAVRISKRYSRHQIEKIAKAAFGRDFAIRSYREVFLPVYTISVENPDGTQRPSYWNALTGKRINFGLLPDA